LINFDDASYFVCLLYEWFYLDWLNHIYFPIIALSHVSTR
jgi:hypothetical protein